MKLTIHVIVIIAVALSSCRISIQKPANNDMVFGNTNIKITGNATYTGLRVNIDGVDVSNQMVFKGSNNYEGDIPLAVGLHTVNATASVSCSYCSGGKTQSTDMKSFVVTNGLVCGRLGTEPIFTFLPNIIAIAQRPGRKRLGLLLPNRTDEGVLMIVDDAPNLLPTQMLIELDIDPATVNGRRAIEAWDFCKHGSRVGVIEASKMEPRFLANRVVCDILSDANDMRSGCTNTQSMLINQGTTGELWLRKTGFLGIWSDVLCLDASIWQAFGGHSVRFIWFND